MIRSAGKAGTWHNLDLTANMAIFLISVAMGSGALFVVFGVSSAPLPARGMSLAEYGAIFTQYHTIKSSSATKLKACLKMGQASILYCGLVLLWVWPVALRGLVSTFIGLPVSMNVSKVWIFIAWQLCQSSCFAGIMAVGVAAPGRRPTVVRLGLFLYHVFLRFAFLLLFVQAKR